MDYFILYLFFKLTDLISAFKAASIALLVFGTLVLVVKFFFLDVSIDLVDKKEELKKKHPSIPKYDLHDIALWANINEKLPSLTKKLKRLFYIGVACLAFCQVLPTTGQLAAIYLGVQAKHSEAFNILSHLPKKYAAMLEKEADAFIAKRMKEVKK